MKVAIINVTEVKTCSQAKTELGDCLYNCLSFKRNKKSYKSILAVQLSSQDYLMLRYNRDNDEANLIKPTNAKKACSEEFVYYYSCYYGHIVVAEWSVSLTTNHESAGSIRGTSIWRFLVSGLGLERDSSNFVKTSE